MGLRFRKSFRPLPGLKFNISRGKRRIKHNSDSQPLEGGIWLGVIIGACIFLWSGSFLLSFIPVFAIPLILAQHKDTAETPAYIEPDTKKPRKRKTHPRQQKKVQIILMTSPVEEIQQSQTADKSRELLPLLEVNKF